jgi:hypothetical protein
VSEHLRAGWRKTASGPGARLQHVALPEDPHDAYAILADLALGDRHTGRRVTAVHPYDHARMADIAANEGFSYHPIHGAAPSGGYMASYHAPEGSDVAQVHHISSLTPEHIAAHRQAIDTHLRNPGSYQGGWHDTATGDVYLDASKHHDDLHPALSFAANQKQKAIFNLNNFSEHFLDPRHDPLAMKDHDAWQERYKETGTEPHPEYHNYAHLYPASDDQKHFWSERGQHLGSLMAGRPVGPWRSERYINRQLSIENGLS